jgi:2'-5' RNA ligase
VKPGTFIAGHVRAFMALTLDAPAHAAVIALIARLKSDRGFAGVRWVVGEGVHLTLRFLGPARPEVLSSLEPVLRDAAARCPASVVHLGGLGLFPERGGPRVLWLGMELPAPVLALQAACEAAARAAGFEAEGRPFRAHLTLGRWRDRAQRPALPGADLGTTTFDNLTLFRSELRSTGAIYTPLATFPLAG